MTYKQFFKIICLMTLSFLAGIAFNPLENYWYKEKTVIAISLESQLYEDSYSQNRINTYINMLYLLLYKNNNKICYFDNNSIDKRLPDNITYPNTKLWKQGVLVVLKEHYLLLLEYPQLKKYTEIKESYDLIKSEKSWELPSAEIQYLKSVEYLKDLKNNLRSDKKHLPSRYQDWLKILQLNKKRLVHLSDRLTHKINLLEQDKPFQVANSYEIDDLLYEVQGSLWAMKSMISASTASAVVLLNEKDLMDYSSMVSIQFYKMDREDYSWIHNRRDYKSKAIDAMKKQLGGINHLLSLMAKLECDKLCQMRKRNNNSRSEKLSVIGRL